MIIYAELKSSRVRHQYETPLGPGAKKGRCFRRLNLSGERNLSILGMAHSLICIKSENSHNFSVIHKQTFKIGHNW